MSDRGRLIQPRGSHRQTIQNELPLENRAVVDPAGGVTLSG